MFRYLRAAFFVRPTIPGLGALPVNVLFVAAMGILGFGHPGFWLLGLGLETAALIGLSTNGRFQKLTDALALQLEDNGVENKRQALIHQLVPPARRKMDEVQAKCTKAVDLAREAGIEDYIIDSNRDAMQKLAWLYLKLLLARQYLQSQEAQASETEIRKQVTQLQRDCDDPKVSASLRESKSATLQILQKRLGNLQKRQESLAEIESDLTRIEAQVDLAVENAGMSGQPQAVSSNISLVSQLLEPDLFGQSQSAVADIDQTYQSAKGARESA